MPYGSPPDLSTDYTGIYRQLNQALQANVRTPGASYPEGGFDPLSDGSYSPFWRSPLPSGAFMPQLTGSGAAGMGVTGQPQADVSARTISAGAGNAIGGGVKEPPPPVSGAAAPAPAAGSTGPMPPPPGIAKDAPPTAADAAAAAPAVTSSGLIRRGPDPAAVAAAAATSPAMRAAQANLAANPLPTEHSNWAQRLGFAVLSMTKLAPYAQQIIHPKYTEEMQRYQAATGGLKTVAETEEAQAKAQQAQAQAMATIEQGRIKPILRKDGSIVSPTGQILTPAIAQTPAELFQSAMAVPGMDQDTAHAYALHLQPAQIEKKELVNYDYLPPEIQKLYTPDAKRQVRVPSAVVETLLKRESPTGVDAPLGAQRVQQFNQLLASRYGVLHPNAPVLPSYQLQPNATIRDYENVERSLAGEEVAQATQANRAVSDRLREQTFALAKSAQMDREGKADLGLKETGFKAFSPALDSAERFNVMTQNYQDAIKSNDQQAMLSLLANHLGMTMGLQKGARLNQAMINEAQQSRPWLQGIQSKIGADGLLTGVTLTPQQMQQMVHLARSRFSEDIGKSRSQASYLGIQDDGPRRTANRSTKMFYVNLANGDPAKAESLMRADGWSF